MVKKKIAFIFGTRPEAIKLAPVIKIFEKDDKFQLVVCITSQHSEMLKQAMDIFSLKYDYDLNIMQPSQDLFYITSEVIEKVKTVLLKEKPELVFVQGDTTTAFAAAVAAFYLKIPVAHVEAGLRSYDFNNPFPEEMNRRLIDHIATIHFPPTDTAKMALLRENIPPQNIKVTGNTIVDAFNIMLKAKFNFSDAQLEKILSKNRDKKIILVTAHRRENFGLPLRNICLAVRCLAERYRNNTIFIWPVHPNPNVKNVVHEMLSKIENVYLLPPLNYFDFVNAMKASYLIMTDSGGIQEEAPSLKKPLLVLRKVTERPEGISCGIAKLVNTDVKKIISTAKILIEDEEIYSKMKSAKNPYGDGRASLRIYKYIKNFFF
jgi:UDP-N-acetylglucosamine 2-epimerase (non-hydrolysing)